MIEDYEKIHPSDIGNIKANQAREFALNLVIKIYENKGIIDLNIEKFSKRLVLLRCLDKLDNLLAFELIPNGDLRTNWLKNTEDYVLPMAKSIDRRFGQYFYSLPVPGK